MPSPGITAMRIARLSVMVAHCAPTSYRTRGRRFAVLGYLAWPISCCAWFCHCAVRSLGPGYGAALAAGALECGATFTAEPHVQEDHRPGAVGAPVFGQLQDGRPIGRRREVVSVLDSVAGDFGG